MGIINFRFWPFAGLGRLQAKLVFVLLAVVVFPMLGAGFVASRWVSASFERRIQSWIEEGPGRTACSCRRNAMTP